MTAELRALYGTDEPPVAARRLAAGPLSADLVGGNLRTIRYEGREVLRAVAYVVRDRDWGTYDPALDGLEVEETAEGFAVRYAAACTAPDGAVLRFRAEIRGRPDGLDFAVEAVPEGDFETNRTGFCILHPIEGLAGRPARVVHTDGRVEDAAFPDLIEPWQPFQEMASIAHEALPGVTATCRMEGDAFEMEDQRAWSDASYKTYVRPLARPWPYRLPSGEPNRQAVRLGIEDRRASRAPVIGASDAPVKIALGGPLETRMPVLTLAVAPEEAEAALAGADRLADLAPKRLLFAFDPAAGHDAEALKPLADLTSHVPDAALALECAVPCRGDLDAELSAMAETIRAAGLVPAEVVVSPAVDRQSTPPGSAWPPCPQLKDVYAAARRAFPGVRLGGGMLSYFTELNRKRVPVRLLDFVTHATCPIVHAADDLSVMQTLEAIPFITRSTRAFIGDAPYVIGPTTIGMRQNPYGSRTMPNPSGRRVPMADDDPRQRGLFAAAWLVGYAARLGEAEIEAWAAAAFAGPRGLLWKGGVVPAFHVVKGLSDLSGARRAALASSDRARIDGFAAEDTAGRRIVWLANLTAEPQEAEVQAEGLSAAVLDASGLAAPVLLAGRLRLPPYAVARLARAEP